MRNKYFFNFLKTTAFLFLGPKMVFSSQDILKDLKEIQSRSFYGSEITPYSVNGELNQELKKDIPNSSFIVSQKNILSTYAGDYIPALERLSYQLKDMYKGENIFLDIEYLNVLYGPDCTTLANRAVKMLAQEWLLKKLTQGNSFTLETIVDSFNSSKEAFIRFREKISSMADPLTSLNSKILREQDTYLLSKVYEGIETSNINTNEEASKLFNWLLTKKELPKMIESLRYDLDHHKSHRHRDLSGHRMNALFDDIERITKLHSSQHAICSFNEMTIDQWRAFNQHFGDKFHFIAFNQRLLDKQGQFIPIEFYQDKIDLKERKGPDGIGDFLTLMISKERFDVINTGFKWSSVTPDIPSAGPGHVLRHYKGFIFAELIDKVKHNNLTVIGTHFTHMREGLGFAADRLNDLVNTFKKTGPVISIGDLNTYTDSPEGIKAYKTLMEISKDTRRLSPMRYQHTKNQSTWRSNFPYENHKEKENEINNLDHILINKESTFDIVMTGLDCGAMDKNDRLIPWSDVLGIAKAQKKGYADSDHLTLFTVLN